MSIKQMSMVWALPASVKSTRRFVLLALADNADDDGVCWPGERYVAEKCSMTSRSVRSIIREMEKAGYIVTESRPGQSSIYHLHLPESPGKSCRGAPEDSSAPGAEKISGGGGKARQGPRKITTPFSSYNRHGTIREGEPVMSRDEDAKYAPPTLDFVRWLKEERRVHKGLGVWANHLDDVLGSGPRVPVVFATDHLRSTREKPWLFADRLVQCWREWRTEEQKFKLALKGYRATDPGWTLHPESGFGRRLRRYGEKELIEKALGGREKKTAAE